MDDKEIIRTLSEAVCIMHRMKEEQHIDPDLFELFLTRGIHLEYGRRFLQPEQLDDVDITRYLRPSSSSTTDP